MRLFLAILSDENMRNALKTAQDRLRKEGLKKDLSLYTYVWKAMVDLEKLYGSELPRIRNT